MGNKDAVEKLHKLGFFAAGAAGAELLIHGFEGGLKAAGSRMALAFIVTANLGALGLSALNVYDMFKLDAAQEQSRLNKRNA